MKIIMMEEKTRLNNLISKLEASLKNAPDGTFYITRDRKKYTKWNLYKNRKNISISKKDIKTAKELAAATFDRIRLKEAREELDAVNAYLRNCGNTDSDKFLAEHPDLRDLLNSAPSLPDNVRAWANEPYIKPDKEYKGTTYMTLKGDLVKSRAEKEIANALFLAGIPYKYECGISFDNGKTYIFPDFTIMDPVTGKIYLWEHFGMEEQNYYRLRNANKMYTYFENGYIPGKNLICTFSNDVEKLTKARIQETINFYFKNE